ncbi:LOW QUALITY PROTEIN: peptidylprolyl isomerase domain and WD repeat-containing protein 1-like [Sarcoramphus papa]
MRRYYRPLTRRDHEIEESSVLGKGIGKLYGKRLMSTNTKRPTSGRNSEMRKETTGKHGKGDYDSYARAVYPFPMQEQADIAVGASSLPPQHPRRPNGREPPPPEAPRLPRLHGQGAAPLSRQNPGAPLGPAATLRAPGWPEEQRPMTATAPFPPITIAAPRRSAQFCPARVPVCARSALTSCAGPLPGETAQAKKRTVLEFEHVYLENLPCASMYECSYMHRDVITHVACTKTDFIITASHDGHVKFWKKIEEGIEFVKHFRSHLGDIESTAVSSEGALFCSVGDDKAMKVFDVVNFDMINMLKLGYYPGQCEWVYCPGDAISSVATSEKSTGKIFIYDGGNNQPLHVFDKFHISSLTQIRLNPIYKVVVSSAKSGMIECWTGTPHEYKFPKNVNWEYKTDTDLYEFAKCKAYPSSVSFSIFLMGKVMKVFDESLSMFTELQQMRQQLPDMEFGQHVAVERELEKVDAIRLINDETGHFVLYGTMLGIKVINVETNSSYTFLHLILQTYSWEIRVMQLALFQGVAKKHRAAITIEMKASENPVLQNIQADLTVICMAFKKKKKVLHGFVSSGSHLVKSADSDRDVFNEKPSLEEVMAATQAEGPRRVSDSAIIHTSMGDINIKLFPVDFLMHQARNVTLDKHK